MNLRLRRDMLEWSGGLWLNWLLGVVETVGPSLPKISKNIMLRVFAYYVQDKYMYSRRTVT